MVFGRSLFLNEINIEKLLNLGYTTIGINNWEFKTDYTAFVDKKMADISEYFPGTCITLPKYKIREPVIYFDEKYNFTHDYVLKWLRGKCRQVVLIGCADFIDNIHYNSSDKFAPSQSCISNSINFIENEAIQWFKILKMNPNSILNIEIWNENKYYIKETRKNNEH